ncbi:TPA: hypothetical protein KM775_003504 [Clostridioides difficile]|nr:hypothetical protein [Clostridioides difficile]HBE8801330.1 hypothetical protein [Clostridioides difficile]HBF6260213.1 hypothetical protein [Clostridioides difficile]HBY2798011.1 hypothetical protein [Clostridioides difficile]
MGIKYTFKSAGKYEVELMEDELIIRNQGALSKNEEIIKYKDIEVINFKDNGMTQGYVRFARKGEKLETNTFKALQSKNAVVFSNAEEEEQAKTIKDYVEKNMKATEQENIIESRDANIEKEELVKGKASYQEEKKEKKKININIIVGLIFFIIIIAFLINLFTGDKDNSKKDEKDVAKIEQVKNDKNLAISKNGKFEADINEKLKEYSDNLIKVSYGEEKNELIFQFNLTGNLTQKMMITKAYSDAKSSIERVIKDYPDKINNYKFKFFSDVQDTYGKESNQAVLTFEYSKGTIDKIVWDKITIEDFSSLADNVWESTALE